MVEIQFWQIRRHNKSYWRECTKGATGNFSRRGEGSKTRSKVPSPFFFIIQVVWFKWKKAFFKSIRWERNDSQSLSTENHDFISIESFIEEKQENSPQRCTCLKNLKGFGQIKMKIKVLSVRIFSLGNVPFLPKNYFKATDWRYFLDIVA